MHETIPTQASSCTRLCLMEKLNMYQKQVIISLELDSTSDMNYYHMKQISELWKNTAKEQF
jgi:hypothetical protein